MLAYVFWHRPAAGQDAAAYGRRLLAFQARLVDVPGLVAVGTLPVPGLPWLPGGGWEDWYLVEDFAALGTLNVAAVDGARQPEHDDVAHRAGYGAGGLYGWVAGPSGLPGARAAWLTKPVGPPYPQYVAGLVGRFPGAAVWQRQMVLGPAPEFRVSAPDLDLAAVPDAVGVSG